MMSTKAVLKLFQKKLPGNPLLLIAPSGPTPAGNLHQKRVKYWNSLLSSLGKVWTFLFPLLKGTIVRYSIRT